MKQKLPIIPIYQSWRFVGYFLHSPYPLLLLLKTFVQVVLTNMLCWLRCQNVAFAKYRDVLLIDFRVTEYFVVVNLLESLIQEKPSQAWTWTCWRWTSTRWTWRRTLCSGESSTWSSSCWTRGRRWLLQRRGWWPLDNYHDLHLDLLQF